MAAAINGTLHGTVVAAGGRAALIRGPSGAGKSDLALRCLAVVPSPLFPHPVELVADDRVELSPMPDGRLMARAPANLMGLIEVRGLGIVRVPHLAEAALRLVVDLVAAGEVERLPDPMPTTILAGQPLPTLSLVGREASAPLKLLLALARV